MSVFFSFFYNKLFYKNLQPLPGGNVRNATSKPAIVKKLSLLHSPLHYFYYIHKKWLITGFFLALSKHNYLMYKNKQENLVTLKILKYRL